MYFSLILVLYFFSHLFYLKIKNTFSTYLVFYLDD